MTVTVGEIPGQQDLTDDALYARDDDDPGDGAGLPPPPAADEIPPGDWTTDELAQGAAYGWTRDRETKQLRPKRAPGRPRTPPPGAEELRSSPPPPPPEADRPPREDVPPPPPTDADVPMPSGGFITKRANRLYRRVGRALRKANHDLGQAFIDATKKEDADDISVGEAWEQLCKENIRVRRFMLGFLKGGTWQDILMAHAPIFGALLAPLLNSKLFQKLPFISMVQGWFERDEDDTDTGRMTADDVGQAADVATGPLRRAGSMATISRLAAKLADGSADLTDLDQLDPELVKQAQAMAAQRQIPAGLRRQQPRNQSRSGRRKRHH